jgi:exonuclease III
MASDNILVWDVRGLNTRLHCDVVRSLVGTEHPSLIYLQETKLSVISDFDIMQILGAGYDYVFIPASHTRGGILVAWCSTSWTVSSVGSVPPTVTTSGRCALAPRQTQQATLDMV